MLSNSRPAMMTRVPRLPRRPTPTKVHADSSSCEPPSMLPQPVDRRQRVQGHSSLCTFLVTLEAAMGHLQDERPHSSSFLCGLTDAGAGTASQHDSPEAHTSGKRTTHRLPRHDTATNVHDSSKGKDAERRKDKDQEKEARPLSRTPSATHHPGVGLDPLSTVRTLLYCRDMSSTLLQLTRVPDVANILADEQQHGATISSTAIAKPRPTGQSDPRRELRRGGQNIISGAH